MIAVMTERTRDQDRSMAKKSRRTDSEREPPGRKQRVQIMPIATIKAQIGDIRGVLADVEASLSDARKHHVESLEIDGSNKMLRAFDLLAEFSDHVAKGVRKAKRAINGNAPNDGDSA
jgi:hypothetical protein